LSSYGEEESDSVSRLIRPGDGDLDKCLLVERYRGERNGHGKIFMLCLVVRTSNEGQREFAFSCMKKSLFGRA
jgi:hypothetical protein